MFRVYSECVCYTARPPAIPFDSPVTGMVCDSVFQCTCVCVVASTLDAPHPTRPAQLLT